MPTSTFAPDPPPSRADSDYLSLLGALAAGILLVLVVIYGVTEWHEVRADQVDQLDTALVLSQKALDRFFVESQAQMRELVLDLADADALNRPRAAHRLLMRYASLHTDALSVNLIMPDGEILATSQEASPSGPAGTPLSMSTYSSFQAFLYDLGNSRDLRLGRPLVGPGGPQWVFPMRYPARDESGRLTAIVEVCVPVDFLEQFWRTAPVTGRASIGLLRDDGFLISRYPVPNGKGPEQVYGASRLDALRIHLLANQFPAKGYVEGESQVSGNASANAFMRLEHFPVTLFVHMSLAEFRAVWWERVRWPLVLAFAVALLGLFIYRGMAARQKAWAAERLATADKLGSLVEHLVAGVVVHEPGGSIIGANPEARTLLGLPDGAPDDAVSPPVRWILVAEDGSDLPLHDYPLARVARTRQPLDKVIVGVRGLGKDTRWLLCSFNPQLDDSGVLLRTVVTFVDISGSRNAEMAMRRSERRFRLLYETNLDCVLQTAIGGDVIAANPAACAMFGTDEAGIRRLGRRGLVSATDPRFDALIARRGIHGHATGVVAMMRADGTPFEAQASTVMYVDGGETYCSWVLHDVTERRVAEAAVAARIAAEDANRAKTEFIAHMSHELRTPLNAILGFSAVLQMDQRRPLHPAHLQQVGHIRHAGTHLLAMISDLLDLSSMETGSVRLNVEAMDPWQLAMQAIRHLAARADAADVRVEIRPPLPMIGPMLGDATRFSQIVHNLLSNAIKYNRPGGRAVVALRVTGGRLALTFSDSGCGMSASQLETLFQPFNRLGREGSNIEGTGIGLVITKRLVALMGGTLAVRSTPDDGSVFEVDLPFAAVEDAMPDTPGAPAGGPDGCTGAVCSVLYIDDDPINRLLVKALLELRDDVRLRLASSGVEGVAAALESRPELVLSDIRMAGINGIDVVRALRARAELQGVRIVAVSASAMPSEIESALAAGFDHYLTKPVAAEQLFHEVDRTLARAASSTS